MAAGGSCVVTPPSERLHHRSSLSFPSPGRNPEPVFAGLCKHPHPGRLQDTLLVSRFSTRSPSGSRGPFGTGGCFPERTALAPPSPSVCLSCPRADSLSESMKKLREEGPIIKEIGDLMLSRVRGILLSPIVEGLVPSRGGGCDPSVTETQGQAWGVPEPNSPPHPRSLTAWPKRRWSRSLPTSARTNPSPWS